jgi:hypothetical protein
MDSSHACKVDICFFGITLDGNQKIIVGEQYKAIFQCQRGFWWGKRGRSPELIRKGKSLEWTEHKELLHTKNDHKCLCPVRTDPVENWHNRVFIPSRINIINTDRVITTY